MSHQNPMRQILVVAISIPLLFSLASSGLNQEPKGGKEIINKDNRIYSVSPPPGVGWIVNADTKKGTVTFWNKKEHLGIDVLRDLVSVKYSWHRLSIEVIANKLLDLIEDAASSQRGGIYGWGPPRISSIKKGESLVDDKRLFFISYTEDRGPAGGKTDCLYLTYFPPDFKKTFEFYEFIIRLEYEGHITGMDPEPVYAVIRSLRINSPFATIPGVDGELIRAAADGQNDLIKGLLDKGANINASYAEGSPLAAAAFYGHLETVQSLIERGADLQGKESKFEATPLLSAISGGEVQIAKLLIEKGADINTKTKDGRTALARAAETAPELVPILVERGADVKAKTAEGRTPLFYAAWVGNAEIVPFLIDNKADLNAPMNNGWTPLMQALDTNHFEIAQYLLNKGADVNLKSNTGWTALMSAVARDASDELIGGLIEHGANVNTRWNNGHTPLMQAVHLGKTGVARLLIEHGADLNQKQDDGQTALMLAASDGHVEIVKLLIEKGADVNAMDNSSRTALKLAISNRHKDIGELLKQAGAK